MAVPLPPFCRLVISSRPAVSQPQVKTTKIEMSSRSISLRVSIDVAKGSWNVTWRKWRVVREGGSIKDNRDSAVSYGRSGAVRGDSGRLLSYN